MGEQFDVSRFVDEHRPGRFDKSLVAMAFLLVLIDGFDIAAIAFALPGMLRDWHVTDMSLVGPVFGAGLLGILIGAITFGWVGDRMGRRFTIVSACILFGVVTGANAWATSLEQTAILRFIAGIGIGGVLPNVGALVAELAPRRWRSTMVIVTYSGIALGGVFPGLIAATLVPTYGWQIIFLVGGVLPLLVAAFSLWNLPESVKFLVVKGRDPQIVARILRRIDPAVSIDEGTRFIVREERDSGRFRLRQLFEQGRAPLTLLAWLIFSLSLMCLFFLQSWTPTLMAAAKMGPQNAAIAGALLQLGGLLGGLCIARPVDRFGVLATVVFYLLAVPVVGAIGFVAATGSAPGVFILSFLAGFFAIGGQLGVNGIVTLIYPTAFRANGTGWAFGIGRVGSIVGPVLGGFLIARHLPIESLYMVAAIPIAVVAISCLVLMRLFRSRIADAPSREGAERPAGLPPAPAVPRT